MTNSSTASLAWLDAFTVDVDQEQDVELQRERAEQALGLAAAEPGEGSVVSMAA